MVASLFVCARARACVCVCEGGGEGGGLACLSVSLSMYSVVGRGRERLLSSEYIDSMKRQFLIDC